MTRGKKPDHPLSRRIRRGALVWADVLVYVLAVVVVVTAIASIVGVATGGGLARVKLILFLAGFGLMAYSTYRLWPSSPNDLRVRRPSTTPETGTGQIGSSTGHETRFQQFVRTLPPGRWLNRPPDERRLAPPAKLFIASIGVVLLSYLMEAVFGVA